ncbi:MAG: hypothetical protein D6732_10470 [Methanobacteriota archaeon]|nr:MAG: hypothetical protein D6732_10470 [Euryarchaeota archaeon]
MHANIENPEDAIYKAKLYMNSFGALILSEESDYDKAKFTVDINRDVTKDTFIESVLCNVQRVLCMEFGTKVQLSPVRG